MTAAEIDDLVECSEMFDFSGFTPEEDKRLLAEVRRLRAALRQYGEHETRCAFGIPSRDLACDCGFHEALR